MDGNVLSGLGSSRANAIWNLRIVSAAEAACSFSIEERELRVKASAMRSNAASGIPADGAMGGGAGGSTGGNVKPMQTQALSLAS